MDTNLSAVINQIIQANKDRRTHLFDVQFQQEANKLTLSGAVLDEATLNHALNLIKRTKPEAEVETTAVKTLCTGKYLWCATNFTSMHAEPSWLAEQLTQCTYGMRFEALKEEGNWVFVRQDDGYLAWIYRPYLSPIQPEAPTHIVSSLRGGLFQTTGKPSIFQTRFYTGTLVAVDHFEGEWAFIKPHAEPLPSAMPGGWIRSDRIISINDLPKTEAEKRQAIIDTAFRLRGVPYLWGGCTTNGIDCSGLAQLCHRFAGLTILRDADMQKNAGRKVEYPFARGDLVFFGDEGNLERITHVGISLGGWQIIHSSRSRNGVYVDDIQKVPHLKDTFAGGCSYL
jgi:gamma-D-glutamyl-L-lysine dipeptidyl-peptidase